jgi:hypothetical protein
MNYRLVVLTHGPDFDCLERTIASVREHVTPEPEEEILVIDGNWQPPVEVWTGARVALSFPEGFCRATGSAWDIAAQTALPFVFYLEHDFVFTRPVDLFDLAHVLSVEPRVAQMALMRDAVNEQEKAAGGLFESRPGQYEARSFCQTYRVEADTRQVFVPWLEHRAYFTTNPSLMRAVFMRENPWPPYLKECEGRFGLDLVGRGYSFGAWGNGEPWVRHIGTRTGHGY